MSASKRGKKRTAQAAAIAPAWRERDPMTQYLGLSKNISKLQAVAPYEEIHVKEIAGKNMREKRGNVEEATPSWLTWCEENEECRVAMWDREVRNAPVPPLLPSDLACCVRSPRSISVVCG